MHQGAFTLWNKTGYTHLNIRHETIEGLRGLDGFSPDSPWQALSPAAHTLVLMGSGERLIIDRHRVTGRNLGKGKAFAGFKPAILDRMSRGGPAAERLKDYVIETQCRSCNGSRWSKQARALRVGKIGLEALAEIPFSDSSLYANRRRRWDNLRLSRTSMP